MAFDNFFEAKHEDCIVRAQVRALKHDETKASDELEQWKRDVTAKPRSGL